MRDIKNTTKDGFVNLHSTKGTHWIALRNGNYFDSYGCSPE